MTERPILFSGPMVRALLDGRKTQTRRICKAALLDDGSEFRDDDGWPLTYIDGAGELRAGCRYGVPGDRLWVRETWRVSHKWDRTAPRDLPHARGMTVMYAAGGSRAHDHSGEYVNDADYPRELPEWAGVLRPSIFFLPRWASRITLELVGVRVERVESISETDAVAEGLSCLTKDGGRTYKYGIADRDGLPGDDDDGEHWREWNVDPRIAFLRLFYGINKRAPAGSNPFVWVVEFRRI